MNTEGADLFRLISKDIDPHKVCSVIDICPKTIAFDNVSLNIFDSFFFMRYVGLV